MKFKIQLITQHEAGEEIQELACLERETEGLEAVGITLEEAKALLTTLQRQVVEQQIAAYLVARQRCPQLQRAPRPIYGSRQRAKASLQEAVKPEDRKYPCALFYY